ncbi:hypothetical protein D9611_010693 [Ephemerocybe angulata]|uniref:Uncharacterized protein n=1 Tax=Ephemerocybe angulata TaxID=980116 RepID=A0A8H5BBV2_9AGAR|nr:hypothetical protein D9611_010693 [Tulosesus angulatus]
MDLLHVFSTEIWRRKAYNVFFWTHPEIDQYSPHILRRLASIDGPVFTAYRLLRAFKSSIAPAKATAMDIIACLEIPTIKSGWRAGQHVRPPAHPLWGHGPLRLDGNAPAYFERMADV